jgi:PAS domain-containing protein
MQTPTFATRPRLLLAGAIALSFVLSACKPDAPATDTAAPTPSAPDAGASPAPAPTSPATPAPTALTEVEAASGATSGMCAFDAVDGSAIADGNAVAANPSAVRIAGWVGDDASRARPSEPALRLVGADGRAWEIALGAPQSRGDVAKHFEADGLAMSGFDTTFDLSSAPAGEYGIAVTYDRAGTRVVCDKGTRLRVGG